MMMMLVVMTTNSVSLWASQSCGKESTKEVGIKDLFKVTIEDMTAVVYFGVVVVLVVVVVVEL